MGVTVETKKEGDGTTRPVKGDKVAVHYVGACASPGGCCG
jgi:FKBP-type peptidyl-prolyl cis-trans isomerase